MKTLGPSPKERWRVLFPGLMAALALSACAPAPSVLPDWSSEAASARMNVNTPAAIEAPSQAVTELTPTDFGDEPSSEDTSGAGQAVALQRGVVYRASEPLLWARPYWATRWLYAGPATRRRAGIPHGLSPYRDAFTALYYPWYGWSPRFAGAYPHPWNAAYQPGFRSWVYTPPFGDADGSDFLFANPGPAIPAMGRAYSPAFSRSAGGAGVAATGSARPAGLSPSMLRLEDFQSPQSLRPLNPAAVPRAHHGNPATGGGSLRQGASSGLVRPGSSQAGHPRR